MKKTYSNRYKPDTFFIRQLKELDPRLGCRFREDLDRFVITWEKVWGMPDEVMVVSKPGFRQPDRRELMRLCDGDLHRKDMGQRLDETAAYFKDYRKRQDESAADDFRNLTKDDKQQLKNAFRKAYNTGGKPSAHRRIEPKPRGASFGELQNTGA